MTPSASVNVSSNAGTALASAGAGFLQNFQSVLVGHGE